MADENDDDDRVYDDKDHNDDDDALQLLFHLKQIACYPLSVQ